MQTILLTLLKKVWWLIPILLLGLALLYQSHELKTTRATLNLRSTQLGQATAMLQEQNAAVSKLQAEGKAAVAREAALAAQKEKVRTQVEVRWQTKLVQVPVPQDCPGAVAAAAVNAAQIGKMFQEAP